MQDQNDREDASDHPEARDQHVRDLSADPPPVVDIGDDPRTAAQGRMIQSTSYTVKTCGDPRRYCSQREGPARELRKTSLGVELISQKHEAQGWRDNPVGATP